MECVSSFVMTSAKEKVRKKKEMALPKRKNKRRKRLTFHEKRHICGHQNLKEKSEKFTEREKESNMLNKSQKERKDFILEKVEKKEKEEVD